MHKDPKSEKKQSSYHCLVALFGSAHAKAAGKMLVKLAPGLNFINILHTTFTCADPRSIKKTVKLSIFFYAFGINKHKSCT